MATEEEASSLRKDLEELKIRNLDAKLSKAAPPVAAAAAASETVAPVSVVKVPATAAVNYVPLSSFCWDQDNDKITFDLLCGMHDVFQYLLIKPSMDKDKDPMAGIMDMMKNMYEEGDDDMKRTIAKSWSEARSGKAADPLKGFN